MANTVTALSYANTFGEWVIATNALITENNTFANTIYTKPRGTLYLQDPTLGVQVTANGIIGGQLLVQGTGSGAYVQNTLRVDGQATFTNTATSLTANGLVNLVGANTALNIANNANISGVLTLTSTARLNANAATIYANNLLVTNSFTVGGAAMSTLSYTQAAFDKANSATNTATNTQAAYDKANSANVLAQSAFNAANTVATNLSANVLFSAAIDAAQNTTIQAAFNKANSALANASGIFAGSLTITGNLIITSTSPNMALTVNGMSYSPTITLTDGTFIVWNTALGNVAQVTLGGNRTMNAASNLVNGGFYSLAVIQNTGSNTLAWNTIFKWTAQTAPTLSTAAGAKDFFVFRSDGTNLYEQGRSLGVA